MEIQGFEYNNQLSFLYRLKPAQFRKIWHIWLKSREMQLFNDIGLKRVR